MPVFKLDPAHLRFVKKSFEDFEGSFCQSFELEIRMYPFSIAQQFVFEAEPIGQLGPLKTMLEDSILRLGFRYFACSSHVDPLHPEHGIMVLNYPRPWVEAYSNLKLHRIDPVFRCADRTRLPFFWDAPEFRTCISDEQLRMLALARSFGLEHGYTVPIHGPDHALRTPSSCSVIPDSRVLDESHYFAVQLIAYYAFDRAARLSRSQSDVEPSALSSRERECLELAAQGKDDWTIGQLLNLSKNTVHRHLDNVLHRMGVSTRVQAVVQALATHQIFLRDIVRPRRRIKSKESK
jgi:DNA-binding CsgD family transcriptional regulator